MIEMNNLQCGYGKKRILFQINATIQQGEITCILGKNGVGKTTLFKTILGLVPPQKGSLNLEGKNIRTYSQHELAKEISYVPQAHGSPFSFTVFDVVLMGHLTHTKGFFGQPTKKAKQVAIQCMAFLGLEELSHQTFSKLSGGQKQMVLIARALAQQPKYIAMDEPTSNLDMGNSIKVMNMAKRLRDKGYGIIMNTHSPEQAINYANHVILLKDGRIAATGKPEEIIDSQIISDIYNANIELVEAKSSHGHTCKVCISS